MKRIDFMAMADVCERRYCVIGLYRRHLSGDLLYAPTYLFISSIFIYPLILTGVQVLSVTVGVGVWSISHHMSIRFCVQRKVGG